jgi:hypothetical protein
VRQSRLAALAVGSSRDRTLAPWRDLAGPHMLCNVLVNGIVEYSDDALAESVGLELAVAHFADDGAFAAIEYLCDIAIAMCAASTA